MLITKFVVPAVVGGVLATFASLGLVWTQTQAPSTNPASSEVLTYGDQG